SLLEFLNIGTSRNIYIIKEISHNPINKSILIEIPDDSCTGEIPILLSVKQGQPTVDQVYNAIYQHGADCQNRIITFTGGHFLDDKFNPSADMNIVKCLVDNMNRFDLNIYLVQMIHDSTSSICDYEILAKPDSHPKFSIVESPSKEKFTETEFWEVYFWGYNNIIEATPFEFGFDSNSEFSQCFPIGDLELETKWTDEGAIIRIEDTSDKKYMLGDIWDDRRDEIQDMFRGCAMELLIQAGATLKLIVKVFDKPIGDLAGMPWREKMHYAGLLWSKFIQIQGFIEKALHDFKKKWGNK
ncbi:MAG: hypothetical protein KAI99_19550, partial [Cyclobacteriaceae bacterium]|nr:hypothetical protein [Cyclobacteriaceae bacterium]